MRAVPLVLAAQFRQQWRPWLVLSLLIAVVCGFVLAAAAAGRRTASAFPRFVASHGYDAIVYTYGPVPGIAHFPGVTSVLTALTPANGPPSCACTEPIGSSHFALLEIPPAWPGSRSWSPAGCLTSRPPTRCSPRSRWPRTRACTSGP